MQIPLLRHGRIASGAPQSAQEIAQQIVRTVLSSPHAYESADGFARRVGLRNRHQLNRALRQANLPGYRVLAAFARVLALRDEAQIAHRSLCAEVMAAGYEPAWAYRTLRRVTGRRWSEVRYLSHDALVELVLNPAPR